MEKDIKEIMKMLRAVVSGQVSLREDINILEKNMNNGFQKVNDRLDNIGKQVAYLEDDAPTRDEHDNLKKRVTKLEQKVLN